MPILCPFYSSFFLHKTLRVLLTNNEKKGKEAVVWLGKTRNEVFPCSLKQKYEIFVLSSLFVRVISFQFYFLNERHDTHEMLIGTITIERHAHLNCCKIKKDQTCSKNELDHVLNQFGTVDLARRSRLGLCRDGPRPHLPHAIQHCLFRRNGDDPVGRSCALRLLDAIDKEISTIAKGQLILTFNNNSTTSSCLPLSQSRSSSFSKWFRIPINPSPPPFLNTSSLPSDKVFL
ncbi:hypothetical protein Ocin01_15382 [Orchesella cincta]|uniref:Uncharacterized protein n=1 Tax=Orchesella cincta TaxID=48709 RepID=A0A1D2ME71_ORCCI|nr:hypothetical protein Ocin01_15382 [Orchesella cincta]